MKWNKFKSVNCETPIIIVNEKKKRLSRIFRNIVGNANMIEFTFMGYAGLQ